MLICLLLMIISDRIYKTNITHIAILFFAQLYCLPTHAYILHLTGVKNDLVGNQNM